MNATPVDPLRRNNVRVSGRGTRPMLFAHGFGCDADMWRLLAPAFEDDYRVVLMDHVGAGGSDLSAYSPAKYRTLQGYADDILDVVTALDLHDVVYVGHSVAAMMGVLASLAAPERFGALVHVGPSPRYIDDDGYTGGFAQRDIDDLLAFMDDNYLGWSRQLAPAIMGNPSSPELAGELEASFCRTDPAIAKQFARVTFLSDNRADLAGVTTPSLILQCSDDIIAPRPVGEYLSRALPLSELVLLQATGHCPHLSAPTETIQAMRQYLHR